MFSHDRTHVGLTGRDAYGPFAMIGSISHGTSDLLARPDDTLVR